MSKKYHWIFNSVFDRSGNSDSGCVESRLSCLSCARPVSLGRHRGLVVVLVALIVEFRKLCQIFSVSLILLLISERKTVTFSNFERLDSF